MKYSEYLKMVCKRFPKFIEFKDDYTTDTAILVLKLVAIEVMIYNDVDSKIYLETRKQIVNLTNYNFLSFCSEDVLNVT